MQQKCQIGRSRGRRTAVRIRHGPPRADIMQNFYSPVMGLCDPNEILNIRKNKVLSFMEKDNFIVNNYEAAPFKNRNHAIECLIPYHLFQIMAEDIKFKGADVEVDLAREAEELCERLTGLVEETAMSEESFASQLLLYHEQRYINSLVKPSKPAVNNKRPEGQHEEADRIRIPRSPSVYAYGPPDRLRLKKRAE
ncbi:hypothetical protein PAPHI01_2603 [Pancytospora philotis]|nr:hypothetical protein PAPHI01_2603 [Pancytospora philotis]